MYRIKKTLINRKWMLIWVMLHLVIGSYAENQAQPLANNAIATHKADSVKAAAINKEAEDPNFVHAYIMDVTPGKAFYSTYGHAAIRMVCPGKKLDYCFTFEMDMTVSSKIDIFTKEAKAGFFIKPTPLFIAPYRQEGRGITAYELNLTPKEKQDLWRFLDNSVAKGASWTFNYTTVNCLSMVFYAIQSTILPEKIGFKQLPALTQADFSDWQDEINRQSPWLNLLMHAMLWGENGNNMSTVDKLTPATLPMALPQGYITDSVGNSKRSLIIGKPVQILPEVYHSHPCWFRPWMALMLAILLIMGVIAWGRKNQQHKKKINLKKKQ